MPGNTNMSIRVDSELKGQAEQTLSQFGMNMTGVVNMFLHQIVRERAVPLSLSLDSSRSLYIDKHNMDWEYALDEAFNDYLIGLDG